MYSAPFFLNPKRVPTGRSRARVSASQAGEGIALVSWSIPDWVFGMVSGHDRVEPDSLGLGLRLYDVTDTVFDGANAHGCIRADVTGAPGCWYFRGLRAGRDYIAQVGATLRDGSFIPVSSSQTMRIG